MSRTHRRATPRNAGATSRYARWYNTGNPDFPQAIVVDAKVVRDGHTIRGCNGDGCDYCSDNRTHSARAQAAASAARMLEFEMDDPADYILYEEDHDCGCDCSCCCPHINPDLYA